MVVAEVKKLGYAPAIVESVDEIGLHAMLARQAAYQKCYADDTASYTVNFPDSKYEVNEPAKVIRLVTT
ncbi:hypothetical protein ACWGRF_04250 [Streptomyces zhihengii]